MTIETWLPALLGYLIPVGLFLLGWGGMEPRRARRSATVGTLALALAALGYFAVGFAFHLGGARVVRDQMGLEGLDWLFAGEGELEWGMIGLKGFFLAGEAATSEALALFVTYLPLVAAAVLLLVLCVSGRARGWQVVVGGLVVTAMLFPLAACWVWGGGWLSNLGLRSMPEWGHGFVDHAGSAVVYLLGGMAALGALVGLGQQLPRGEPGEPAEMPPAHFPLLANLGAMLFGLGWLGWSLSLPFHVVGAELNLPRIAVNGLLAGAGAVLVSQIYCWATVGHADPLMSARGAAVGFIAISAGAPFVPPWAALVIGAVAGLLLPLGVYLVERGLRLPDGTAAVPLGIVGGLWGALAVAIFADGRWGQGWNGVGLEEYHTIAGMGVTGLFPAEGFIGDGLGQLIAQLAGIGAIGLMGFLVSWLLFLALSLPYRPRKERKPKAKEAEQAEEAEKAEGAEEVEEAEEAEETEEAEQAEEAEETEKTEEAEKAEETEETGETEQAEEAEETEEAEENPSPETERAKGGGISARIGEAVARWTEFLRK